MNAVVDPAANHRAADSSDKRVAEMRARLRALNVTADEAVDNMASLEHMHAQVRAQANEAEARLKAIEGSRSFVLARAIMSALASWRGLVAFPGALMSLIRRRRASVAPMVGEAPIAKESTQSALRRKCLTLFARNGLAAAEAFARRRENTSPEYRSAMLMDLAKSMADYSSAESGRLALKAWREHPEVGTALWCAWRMFDAGNLPWAGKMLAEAEQAGARRDYHKSWWIRELLSLASSLPELPDRSSLAPQDSRTTRVLYLTTDDVPRTGFSTRSRADVLARAFEERGASVIPVRMGGWVQHKDAIGEELVLDGFVYDRPLTDQLSHVVEQLATIIECSGATSVHAERSILVAWVGLAAARMAGVAFLYDAEGPDVTPLDRAPRGSRLDGLRRALERRILRDADVVLAPTIQQLKRFGSSGASAERLLRMPAMVDVDRSDSEPVRLAARARLTLPDNAFVVGGVDEAAERPTSEDLLIALGELLVTRPNVCALVMATPERAVQLRVLAEQLGLKNNLLLCEVSGTSPDRQLLDASDVFWLQGSAPRALALDAMASGLPLITAGDNDEWGIRAKGVGLTYEAGDAHALATCLLQLIKRRHRRAAMGVAARNYALAENDAYQVAHRMFAVHASIGSGEGTARLSLLGMPHVYDKEALDSAFLEIYKQGGAFALDTALEEYLYGLEGRFPALCRLRAGHLLLQRGDSLRAGIQSSLAHAGCSEGPVLRAAARLELQLGRLDEADRLIRRLRKTTPVMGASDLKLERQILDRHALREAVVEPPCVPAFEPVAGRSVYFLHFSLPYVSVGYATRSQGLIAAIQGEGWDVRAYTRLGFPEDFQPELGREVLPETSDVDGVHYHRLEGMGRRGNDEAAYLLAAADKCEEVLRRERPQVVHAASNYATALPALIAARRLGLPFVYEMRGFWEITRGSRDETFMNSAKFHYMRQWEDLVAGHADRVVVITSAMREALVDRGIERDRISIAYNSVDVEKFQPRPADAVARHLFDIPDGVPVVGYVGSFVDYEGLDDLVEAAAMLRAEGNDFRLLLIGDGSAWEEIRQRVADRELGDICQLPGRIGHDEVQAAYAVIDVCPFPRKPWPVCEMVSPLKPFEAMAMGKPVLVSDTAALKEIVQDGITGLTFTKGDVADLARALKILIGDKTLRDRLGAQGRNWVSEHRTWSGSARSLIDAYRQSVKTSS